MLRCSLILTVGSGLPNLIWFDNLRSYGTPNYYVQKLFSLNKGTNILPVLLNGSPRNAQENLFASAAIDRRAGELILKLVNATPDKKDIRITLAGGTRFKNLARHLFWRVLTSRAENSLDQPTKLSPVQREFQVQSPEFGYTLDPNSLTVLRIATR